MKADKEPVASPTSVRLRPTVSQLHCRVRMAKFGLGAVLLLALAGFAAVYTHYAKLINKHLSHGESQVGTLVYSAPHLVEVGEAITQADIIKYLERCGYRHNDSSKLGRYRVTPEGIEISTGPDSYFRPHEAVIEFAKGRVSRIRSKGGEASNHILLEPELVTNVVQGEREKRRPVQYSDLPKFLVEALIATEDKRFFDHRGLDVLRVGKAAYIDVREGRKEQGASTITMQLARSFYLDQEKSWGRKFAEAILTIELERRFSKQQILELYANEVYLGRRGSFSVHGFGQAAHAYFNKDVRALTLPEAALLVGMIQRPAYFNPFKYPERAGARRNLVLTLMLNNGFIDAETHTRASQVPFQMSPGESESNDAPYFVDLVNSEIEDVLGETTVRKDSYRVYTSLDTELQREASAAVRQAMQEVDRNVRAQRGAKYAGPMPQVALVALDPHTGAVRALVGGRSYSDSQLNHALAKRQPGSSFKPFVYAAALNTAFQKSREIITASTILTDEPTVFKFGDEVYEPANFDKTFRGDVSMRDALMKSLNVPTVKLAEKVGYRQVSRLAKAAGMNENLHATPALALGAYEVTPLEIASAYTIFSNQGEQEHSFFIDSARDRSNNVVYSHRDEGQEVLDPRVSYIVLNMMEDVIRSGTAAGVRSRGFDAPAAGKTGTSRDGWFAGFTSNLLTVVWIGYDDNSELDLEGAKSALPVWVDFMKRAHKLQQYRNPKPFTAPKGIAQVSVDPTNGGLAGAHCPLVRDELYIEGTQPRWNCELLHEPELEEMPEQSKDRPGIFGRIVGIFH